MRLPQYEPSGRIPNVGTAVRGDVEAAGAGGRALQRAGLQISQVGEEMQNYEAKREAFRQRVTLMKATAAASWEMGDLINGIEQSGDFINGEERFNTGANEIKKKYGDTLQNTDTRQLFEGHLEQFQATHGTSLKRKLFEIESNDAKAALVTSLDQFAKDAATAPNDLARENSRQAGAKAIADMGGIYVRQTEKAALWKKFNSQIDEQQVLSALNGSEEQVNNVIRAIRSGVFKNLDPVQNERLLKTAESTADRMQRERISKGEHEERTAVWRMGQNQNTNVARIVGEISTGKDYSDVQLGQILARQEIDTAGLNFINAQRTRRDVGVTNPLTETEIREAMIRNGEDVFERIKAARNANQLSAKDADSLMKDNQSAIERRTKEPWKSAEEKRGAEYMERMITGGVGLINIDRDAGQRYGQALDEYHRRIQAGEIPDTVSKELVGKWAENIKVSPRSTVFEEPKTREDGEKALKKLDDLKAGGFLTPEAYNREMRTLAERLRNLPPPETPKPKVK